MMEKHVYICDACKRSVSYDTVEEYYDDPQWHLWFYSPPRIQVCIDCLNRAFEWLKSYEN